MSEKIIKTYKFRLYPSKAQVKTFEHWLDLCRELYNAALQERRDAWKLNRISVSYFDQQYQFTEIRQIREDIAELNSAVLREQLRRIDKTFKAFFERVKKGVKVGFPRFKNKSRFNSFTFNDLSGTRIIGNKLLLSKIGKVKIKQHREIEGKIKNVTIKREIDKWFAVFDVECKKNILLKTGATIGVDVGLESFATLSNGEKIENPHFLKQAEKRLKTAQRKLSRRKKGSNRRRRAARLVAKQYLKIKNQRRDFLHKQSTDLIKRFDEIAVEDLKIKNLVKNKYLAKSISDVSWGTFFSMLESKAENAGRRVWKVAPRFTSQTCSRCGDKAHKTLNVRKHHCLSCGLRMHRDENAAINIRARIAPAGMLTDRKADEPRTPIQLVLFTRS